MYETTWQYPSQSTIDPISLAGPVAEPDNQQWWRLTNEPVREIPRPLDTGIFVFDPSTIGDAENIFPEEFWVQRPEWFHHLRPVDEGLFVTDPHELGSQEFVGPEEFWRQTEEPVRQIPRPVDEGYWAIDQENLGTPEFVGPEEFRAHNPEWIAAVPRPVDTGIWIIDLHTLGDAEFISVEEFWVQRPEWIKHLRPTDEGLFVIDPIGLSKPFDIDPPSATWSVIYRIQMQYPSLATMDPVTPVAEEVDSEHWWRQPSEPVFEIKTPEGLFVIDLQTIGDQEFVSPEEFVAHNPDWLVHLRLVDEGLFISDTEMIGIESELEFWRPISEPVREILRPVDEGLWIIDLESLGQQEFVGPEEFKAPNPDWIQHLRLTDEGLFIIGEETADTGESPEKWWRVTDPIFDIKPPEGLWVIDPITFGDAEFAALEWWLQRPEWIDAVKRPVDEGIWVIDRQGLGDAEFAALEWFLQRPEWLQHLRPTDTGLWVADTVMEEISAELEWWRPAEEPVRQLPRPTDEGLFVIDLSTIGNEEFIFPEEFWRQNPEWFLHLRPTDTGLWIGEVNPVFVPSEDTSWWRQTEEPVRELLRAIDEGLFVTDLFRQGDTEFAALEWLIQRPEWIARLLPVDEGLWVIDLPTVPDIEQWWRQTSEPVRKQPRPVDEGLFTLDPTTRGNGEFVGPEEFKAHNPDWLHYLRAFPQGFYVIDPIGLNEFVAVSDIEHWWRQTSEPVREIPRPVDTGLFVTDLFRQGDTAFDSLEWLVQRPEWIERLLPTGEGIWVFSPHIEQVQQDDIEHWWRQTNEPVRLVPRFVDVGIFVIDPTTLGAPGIIVVIIPEAILEGCVDLDDLVDRQRWIDAVPASGFIDTIWYIVPSGYIKRSGTGNLWDF